MRVSPRALCIAAVFFLPSLLGVARALGQEGSGLQPAAKAADRYGDALPEGAVARLGTLRLTHPGGVSAVAVSPDGKIAASGVRNGEQAYREETERLPTGTSSGGKRVQVTPASIRFWDTQTGKLIREIPTPDAPVSSICFGPAGKTFFAGCGRFICCWNTDSGKKLWEREGIQGGEIDGKGPAYRLVLAHDLLASFHFDTFTIRVKGEGSAGNYTLAQRFLRLWNSETGAPLPLAARLESSIVPEMRRVPVLFQSLAVSADVRRAAILASVADLVPQNGDSNDWHWSKQRLEVIDVATGKVLRSMADPEGTLAHPTFTPDGRELALAAGKEKEIWLIEVETGRKRVVARDIPVARLAFIDGKRLAAVVDDESRQVRVWNLDGGDRPGGSPVREEQLDACGLSVVGTGHGNSVRLIDVNSGKSFHSFEGHRLPPSLRYSLNSSDTLISRDAEIAHLWDTRSWQVKKTVSIPAWNRPTFWLPEYDTELDHRVTVEKGLYFQQGDAGGQLRGLGTGQVIRRLENAESADGSCYFSTTGNRLVCLARDSCRVFDTRTGQRLARMPGDQGREPFRQYCKPELSSRGKYFARKVDVGPEVELYDVDRSKFVRKLTPRLAAEMDVRGNVFWLRFSADERLLFGEVHEEVVGRHGLTPDKVSVTIWSVDTGAVLHEIVLDPRLLKKAGPLALLTRMVDVLAMSNDNRLVALAGLPSLEERRKEDGDPIEIWEVASGRKRGEWKGHGPITDLAFSPDSRQLASAGEDSTILIWDMNRPLQPGRFPAHLSGDQLAECWQALSEPDAARADVAIWRLVRAGRDSVPFLKGTLLPLRALEGSQVRELLAGLDADDFRARQRAEAELAAQGDSILCRLEETAKQPNSPEKSKRLGALIARARALAAEPFRMKERVRQWRALEVLERIGDPEARRIVQQLSDGAPGAWLTTAAKDVLARLDARQGSR